MRSAFWAELRRSPLRWWLPVLAALNLLILAGDEQVWVGIWPRASAAALRPVVFLGPLVAAGAAWAAVRASLPGVADRVRGSVRPAWVPDAAQLTSSAVIGLCGYLVGLAYVAVFSFSQAGPGFLWPGYLLLGAAATVACAAIGHGVGRATGSRFGAPIAAGAGCLVLMMAFSSVLGLTNGGNAVLGDPAFSVAPDALAARGLLAVGLATAAVTVPAVLGWGSGRWRPPLRGWLAAVLAVAVVVAAAALMPAQQVLAARAAPADPVCSATVPRVCLWPEDRRYLKDVTALAMRAGHLPAGVLRVPGTFYEQGLKPADPSTFSIDYGSVSEGSMWFVASAMAWGVSLRTFGSRSCLPRSMSQASYNELENASFGLIQWIATRIFGGPQPPTVFGWAGLSPSAAGRLAREPEATQAAFARAQARVEDKYLCRKHGQG